MKNRMNHPNNGKKRIAALAAVLAAFMTAATGVPAAGAAFALPAEDTVTCVVRCRTGAADRTALRIRALTGAYPENIYHYAFDGVAVSVPSDRLDDLSALPEVVAVHAASSYGAPDEAEDGEETKPTSNLSGDADYRASRLYSGQGTVAAVIDTGFAADSDLFRLPDGVTGRLDRDDLTETAGGKAAYVSEKIPYAYDYSGRDTDVRGLSSHGTSVAALLAGCGDGVDTAAYYGAAPAAQLLLMKVFSDDEEDVSRTDETVILAALDDAVRLGADVINLSIGSHTGTADGTPMSSGLDEVLDEIRARGTLVVCAAGNDGTAGEKSAYEADYAIARPLAIAPDTGTVSSPASVTSTLAVAGGAGQKIYELSITAADGARIRYSDTSYSFLGAYFSRTFDGMTLPYVAVGGVGAASDYGDADLDGALALVERGDITFAEKAAEAAAHGAVGLIVYNYDPAEGHGVNMDLTDSPIPGIFISAEDGELLKKAEKKNVSISFLQYEIFDNPAAGTVSGFSSVGPTADLGLKPDLTATGEDLVCLEADGTFRYASGTSMAAPMVSGMALALRQALTEAGLDASPDAIKTRLMNTAAVSAAGDGTEVSPRRQGAGFASFEAARTAPVLLTGRDGEPSVSLGDGLKNTFSFPVKLKNPTDEAVTCDLSASVLTDGRVTWRMDEEGTVTAADNEEGGDLLPWFVSENVRLKKAAVRIGGEHGNVNRAAGDRTASLTLKPGETRTVTVSVTLSKSELAPYREAYENGFYLEGFVYADCGGALLSLPFCGFSGDWATLDVFDRSFGDAEHRSLYQGNVLCTEVDPELFGGGKTVRLGSNLMDETDDTCDPSRAAFSPDGDGNGDILGLSLALLRSVKDLFFEVKDAKGETIYTSAHAPFIPKNYPTDFGYAHYDLLVWDGSDGENGSYIFPDGAYTVTVTATPCAGDKPQTMTFPVTLDTRAPRPIEGTVVCENGREILRITAEEDNGLMYAVTYEAELNFISHVTEPTKTDADGRTVTLDFDITDYTGRYLYLELYDFACNSAAFRLDLRKAGRIALTAKGN